MITRRQIVLIVLIFVVTRVALTLVGVVSMARLSSNEGEEFTHLLDGGAALDMWYRWDAGFYATIATEGYDWVNEQRPADDMAFLPLYPYSVRAVMALSTCGFSPYLSTCATVAGVLVSNAALLAAGIVLFSVARRHFGTDAAWRAVWLLMLSPASIFFSAVYTESLFLLLSVLTFWLLDRDRFMLAVVAACLAALTRTVGAALVPALLWYVWTRARSTDGERFQTGAGRAGAVMLALLPGILYAAYVVGSGLFVGDPLAYFKMYAVTWDRPTGSVIEAFTIYFSGVDVSLFGWDVSWIDLAATLGALALAVVVLRRYVGWGLFALFAVLMPVASGTLIGMPRFAAVIFPFYLVIAAWADRWWKQALVYAVSVALLLLMATRFVTWRWIA